VCLDLTLRYGKSLVGSFPFHTKEPANEPLCNYEYFGLSNELVVLVFSFLDDPRSLLRCAQCSRHAYSLATSDALWRSLFQRHHSVAFERTRIRTADQHWLAAYANQYVRCLEMSATVAHLQSFGYHPDLVPESGAGVLSPPPSPPPPPPLRLSHSSSLAVPLSPPPPLQPSESFDGMETEDCSSSSSASSLLHSTNPYHPGVALPLSPCLSASPSSSGHVASEHALIEFEREFGYSLPAPLEAVYASYSPSHALFAPELALINRSFALIPFATLRHSLRQCTNPTTLVLPFASCLFNRLRFLVCLPNGLVATFDLPNEPHLIQPPVSLLDFLRRHLEPPAVHAPHRHHLLLA